MDKNIKIICGQCKHHIRSKQFSQYCWCKIDGNTHTQSKWKAACDKFEHFDDALGRKMNEVEK